MPNEGIEIIIVELSWEGRGTDSDYGLWVRNYFQMGHVPTWYYLHLQPKDLDELRALLLAHRPAVREVVVVFAGAGRSCGVLLNKNIIHYEGLFTALANVPWLGNIRLVHYSTCFVMQNLENYQWMCPISG
ncbi:MAG: hypothetical protein ACK56F_29620, partial [bacterium]